MVATRERPAERGRRRATGDLATAATEIRRARVAAGLSLRVVATAAHVTHTALWRFERGRLDALRVDQLGAISAVVGLDLRLKAYPRGDALRDAGQARLLGRLRTQLHPTLRWRTEVPLPIEGDLRAWDAVISGRDWLLPVEAETVLADIQAVERRLALKRRDGNAERVLVIVSDSARNRAALNTAPASFGGFVRETRPVLAALRGGRDPGTDAIVFL